ncbi:MAG: DUF58 domain-containing protein [Gemmatimonadaceae bacterium]|nr:DUF58 domain-containing protein [Gemmatimonadaceae bacterium]
MPVGPYGALLDAVRGVRWPARRPVPQGAPGAHQARSRGAAPEFAEYRPYRQGDDPRRLDWKLLARSDRAFIRLAPDHATLGTTFVVDASASMGFPAADANKWTTAKAVAVGLAAVAHASGDPVGLLVNANTGPIRLQPRTRAGVLADITRTLNGVEPSGARPLTPLLAASAARCVLITDCLGDFDSWRAALAQHVVRGGEAYLVHVVSRQELEPPPTDVMARDPEDPSLERPLVPFTRDGYRQRFAAFRTDVAQRCRRDGVVVHEIVDDEPVELVVRRVARAGVLEVTR